MSQPGLIWPDWCIGPGVPDSYLSNAELDARRAARRIARADDDKAPITNKKPKALPSQKPKASPTKKPKTLATQRPLAPKEKTLLGTGVDDHGTLQPAELEPEECIVCARPCDGEEATSGPVCSDMHLDGENLDSRSGDETESSDFLSQETLCLRSGPHV